MNPIWKKDLHSQDQLEAAANELIESLENEPSVICVEGEMGAGKTTFITAVCHSLGSLDEPSSPTFSIVNEYNTEDAQTIYHFDLYRLEDFEEILAIGFEEYLQNGNWCFIEWPERILHLLDEGYYRLVISVDKAKRSLSLYKC